MTINITQSDGTVAQFHADDVIIYRARRGAKKEFIAGLRIAGTDTTFSQAVAAYFDTHGCNHDEICDPAASTQFFDWYVDPAKNSAEPETETMTKIRVTIDTKSDTADENGFIEVPKGTIVVLEQITDRNSATVYYKLIQHYVPGFRKTVAEVQADRPEYFVTYAENIPDTSWFRGDEPGVEPIDDETPVL